MEEACRAPTRQSEKNPTEETWDSQARELQRDISERSRTCSCLTQSGVRKSST